MAQSAEYDLVVIGSGPAGEKGAAQAAYFGKKVAIVEREENPGGAGINTGTVPSKTLRETALYFSGLRQRGLYGIDYSLKENLSISDFMFRKQIVIENEHRIIRKNLQKHGIEWVQGDASLESANQISVSSQAGERRILNAKHILIATGSSPFHPPGIEFDHTLIYDSDSVLHMNEIPKSIAVIGGGVIGSEYASMFAALGIKVSLIDTRERLLPFVDGELAEALRSKLESIGVKIYFNVKVEKFARQSNSVQLCLSDGTVLEEERVLVAAGRQSNVESLNLESIGVKLGNRGLILVNEKYQTSVESIYAAGDVIGFPALASTSMEQARVAMVHAFDLGYKKTIATILPLAVYTIPEISMVGITEEECIKQDIPYVTGTALYEKSPRGQIVGDLAGKFKLIFSRDTRKLLGAHIIGEMASELIHVAMHVMTQGGGIDDFIAVAYNYPTLTDSYKYAAYDALGKISKIPA